MRLATVDAAYCRRGLLLLERHMRLLHGIDLFTYQLHFTDLR